jgi:hypothetical protein
MNGFITDVVRVKVEIEFSFMDGDTKLSAGKVMGQTISIHLALNAQFI